MPSIAQIREVCERHTSNSLFVAPIQILQLTNARVALSIPAEEEVIGLANLTLFGSCKHAIAICSGGIYIRNIGTARDYLTWNEIGALTFEHTPGFFSQKVRFSDGRSWNVTAGDTALSEDIPVIFRSLRDIARDSHSAVPTIEWHLAVHQKKFGPYDTDTLKSLVASGQVDPSLAFVWRDGMVNWSPYNDVREFNALPNRPLAVSPIPRPPCTAPPIGDSELATVEVVETLSNSKQSTVTEIGPRVDLNNAPLDDLLYLPGLTLAFARQLMQERQLRLGFQTIEEVGEVLGLPPHKVQRLRERTRIERFVGTSHPTSARGRVVDF